MTSQQWWDRAEAWLNCADLMTMEWTDESGEREQGLIVEAFCRKKYNQCMDKVHALEKLEEGDW